MFFDNKSHNFSSKTLLNTSNLNLFMKFKLFPSEFTTLQF